MVVIIVVMIPSSSSSSNTILSFRFINKSDVVAYSYGDENDDKYDRSNDNTLA